MHARATVGMPHANPRTGMPRLRRSRRRPRAVRAKPTFCASNQGQGWSLVIMVDGAPVESYKATTSGSKHAYGQIWWYVNVTSRPLLPDGFHDWVPRCGTEHVGQMR